MNQLSSRTRNELIDKLKIIRGMDKNGFDGIISQLGENGNLLGSFRQ